jgi:subtilisin family serine protease
MHFTTIRKFIIVILFLWLIIPEDSLHAQKKYWVFLSDKEGVEFNPFTYFDESVIVKRQQRQIPLVQYTDLPVREDYLSKIEEITGNAGVSSRWFNAVSVKTDKKSLNRIAALPFVKGIQEIAMVSSTASEDFNSDISFDDDQLRESQINAMGIKYFEETGIDGRGVRIAVFDGGFPGVDTSPLFQHLRDSGRIIATWDFVKDKEFVYDYSSHGTSVLTCIAGVVDNKKFGLAPEAEFLLARTEVVREVFSEEENWLAAVEWADKNGADIISSSLGYTYKRYFPKEMDGKTTLVTRAANMAASKGILVLNAAGNDGDKKWEVVGAPADADSILSIGGVSPDNGYHIDFSSYGPTSDGRMKPNLVAFGQVTTSSRKKVKQSFGTSFSTPLVSGFAACVMQIHPEWNNMKVFSELEKSGHLYPYFDYAHGYGVPQASYFSKGKIEKSPTFGFSSDADNLKIKIINRESGIDSASEVENEEIFELADSDEGYELDYNYLYFHIFPDGEQKMKRYAVINMESTDEYLIPVYEMGIGDRVSVYFRGYSETFIF